jgi:hypothetical protein
MRRVYLVAVAVFGLVVVDIAAEERGADQPNSPIETPAGGTSTAFPNFRSYGSCSGIDLLVPAVDDRVAVEIMDELCRLPGVATALPRTYSRATDRNLRGRSISSGVRLLIHDQPNPCLPPAKVRFIRLASVFAGHTRTNHASCAAGAVQNWIPMIDAIEDANKNARTHPSISVE